MLETKNNKMMQRVMMMAVLIIGLFVIGANQAIAQSRIFNFYIQNIDSAPVTVTLGTENCYEGNIPNGQIWENIPPQGKVKIVIARIQGHGCDGEYGGFNLIFNPKVGVNERIHFVFTNDGSLAINPSANQYPGILSAKSPQDESYTYTTFARAKLTASKPQGFWDKLCAENCNEKYSEQITNETGSETTISEETKSAISVALEAGVEFGAGSASTTVTASLEKTVGKSMSSRVMRSESKTKEKTVIYTPEQMNSFNIHAVWQWQAKTRLSNGQSYIVKTEEITCTSDGIEPNYLPGSKEHIGACRGKLTASAEKPQDATPKPTPVEAPKPTQVETPNPNSGRQEVDIEFTTSYSSIWNDSGSGANSQVSFWRPNITSGWSRVGHHISNGYGNPQGSTMLVRPRTSGAISDPVDYTLVWTDAGSGASQDGSVWRPVCKSGYQALGDVTSSSHAKPATTEMVCVHESALVNANPGNPIWNDAGSGATKDFGSWEINPSTGNQSRGLFFGSASHSRPQITLWAVRSNAVQR